MLVIMACGLATYLPWAINFGTEGGGVRIAPMTPDLFTFAGSSFLVGSLFLFVGWAFLVYVGFQTSAVWGFANLLFFPAGLVFIFRHPRRSRDAISFVGLGLLFHLISALLTPTA